MILTFECIYDALDELEPVVGMSDGTTAPNSLNLHSCRLT